MARRTVADGLSVLSILDIVPRRMGSIEEYLCALGRRLRADGGRCVAGITGAPPPEVADEFRRSAVEWQSVPFGEGFRAAAVSIRRLVREVRPRVAHFHFVGLASPLFWAARLAGARPIVVSHHFSFPLEHHARPADFLGRWRRSLALAPVALLVTPSEYIRECLVSRLCLPRKRTRVILNGVNIERFRPDRRPSFDVRAEYGIAPDAPVVSTLAFFIPQKGGEDLVRAVPAVLAQVPDAHFMMIGDGPEIPRLKALTAELKLMDRVHFTGLASGDRMDSLVAESLVTTLFCTWGEAFSLVVLEFMACGKPVVATAVGGTPEAVADGETGLLVPPHSPERISEALVTLLKDPARAKEMGRAGRRRAEGLFDVDRMVSDTMDVYRQVTR